jgi:hypothetical protein
MDAAEGVITALQSAGNGPVRWKSGEFYNDATISNDTLAAAGLSNSNVIIRITMWNDTGTLEAVTVWWMMTGSVDYMKSAGASVSDTIAKPANITGGSQHSVVDISFSNATGVNGVKISCFTVFPDSGKALKLKGRSVWSYSFIVAPGATAETVRDYIEEVPAADVPVSDRKIAREIEKINAIAAALGAPDDLVITDEPPAAAVPWAPSEFIRAGQVRLHAAACFRCIQAHVTQAGWEPPAVPALWVKVAAPAADGAPPAWVQPTGAHDAYAKDARVTHNGKAWESTVNANIYAPGVVAAQWTEVR